MVFQNHAIFPHLDVRRNIDYSLRKQGLSQARRDAMVDQMLDLVQLPGYGSRKPHELSGGQRLRVALARALILSDRIAVMADGRILQVDTTDGLYETLRSRQVALFVGTMNFLRAQVVAIADDVATPDVEGLGRRTVAIERCPKMPDRHICVAIRPEKPALHPAEPEPAGPVVSGTAEARVYLGERRHDHIRIDGCHQPIAVSKQNTSLRNDRRALEGCRVWLTREDEALIPLDPE